MQRKQSRPSWLAPPPPARPAAKQRAWRPSFRRSCYRPCRQPGCGYCVAGFWFTLGSGCRGVWESQIVAVLQLAGRCGALERNHPLWKWISNPP